MTHLGFCRNILSLFKPFQKITSGIRKKNTMESDPAEINQRV